METGPQRRPKAKIPLLGGQLTPGFEHFSLQIRTDPDMKIMIYIPYAETRTKLRQLLAE